MKKIRWMVVVPLLTGALAFASTARADKPGKEITVTPAADVKFMPLDPNDKEGKGPQVSVVFGDMKKKGTPLGFLLKLPPGFKPGPHTHTSDDYAVIIQGSMHNFAAGGDEGKAVEAGGTWFQPGKVPHDNHCASTTPCVFFVYTPKGFDFLPVKDKAAAAPKAAPAGEKTAAAEKPAADKPAATAKK